MLIYSSTYPHQSRVSRELLPFTLIELLVVVSIIMILASMLVPALSRSREMAKRRVCMNNEKQILLASQFYMDENDDWLPYGEMGVAAEYGPSANIRVEGQPYNVGILWTQNYLSDRTAKVMYCPSRMGGWRYSAENAHHGLQRWLYGPGSFQEISYAYRLPMVWRPDGLTCLLADVFHWDSNVNPPDYPHTPMWYGAPTCHGGNYYNAAMSDGSVQPLIDSGMQLSGIEHFTVNQGLITIADLLR